MRYVVYLTNPDDQEAVVGSSYTSGRYGFTVRAADMEAAQAAVVARARRDGFYGHDWSARIAELDKRGKVVPMYLAIPTGQRETIIFLRDAAA